MRVSALLIAALCPLGTALTLYKVPNSSLGRQQSSRALTWRSDRDTNATPGPNPDLTAQTPYAYRGLTLGENTKCAQSTHLIEYSKKMLARIQDSIENIVPDELEVDQVLDLQVKIPSPYRVLTNCSSTTCALSTYLVEHYHAILFYPKKY